MYHSDIDGAAVGQHEIIGLEEIIGQAETPREKALVAATMRAARQVDPNAVLVQQKKLSNRKRNMACIPATSVGAGATLEISFTVSDLFKPSRLQIEDALTPDFVVNNITIGSQNQFLNANGMPADAFRSDAVDNYLDLDTINPGVPASITVTNTSGGALVFRGGFFGTVVR